MIIEVNNERLKNVNVKTTEGLLRLLKTDERLFDIYLLDSYLRRRDLSDILSGDFVELRMACSLLLVSADKEGLLTKDMRDYFEQYLCMDESLGQMRKVLGEIKIEESKKKYLKGAK